MPFDSVTTWVFDLDNTLYPPSARLLDQIELRMTDWIVDAFGVDPDSATQMRQDYWSNHGTTLAGLMANHKIDPDQYLDEVHQISLDALSPDQALANAIAALPGRKIVYTNGATAYAHRVIAARGLSDQFDAVYGVEHAGYRSKPQPEAFAAIFDADGLEPARAAMFDDAPRNLAVPHEMGLRTVHVAPDAHPAPFIHHHTDDLVGFLSQLINRSFPPA